MALKWYPETGDHQIEMSPEEFEFFRTLIRGLTGIELSSSKIELLKSRLRHRLNDLSLRRVADYRSLIGSLPVGHPEWQELINVVTTNKTDWFREPAHFVYLLEDFLPRWRKKAQKSLQVWSAACSTGEEPYTVAAVLQGEFDGEREFEIQATDIDTETLKTAKNGVYRKSQLVQVPEEYRDLTFAFGTGEIRDWMKVRSPIKSRVRFDQLNLLERPYPWQKKFDVIFCRNVFIYFSKETIQEIVEGLYETAASGAVLFISHSESLQNMKTRWVYVKPSVYLKP
jgi:chemotaxis protein methyltransferase CheR